MLILTSVFSLALIVTARGQAVVTAPNNNAVSDRVAALRSTVLTGHFGQIPAQDLVDAVIVSQGPSLAENYLAIAVRKQEALPIVLEKLRTGNIYEKRMMTKILRYLGWPEAVPTLVAIVQSEQEHPIARLGATYALGAIGDPVAGEALIGVLDNPGRSVTEKGIAIASLARIGYSDAVKHIRPYTNDGNIRTRITAVWALAELKDAPDPAPLFEAIENDDYVVRQEACGALGLFGGDKTKTALNKRALADSHQVVRDQALVALRRVELDALASLERVTFLDGMLSDENEAIRGWALATLSTRCGREGRALLQKKSQENSGVGQACRSTLVMLEGASPQFRGQH